MQLGSKPAYRAASTLRLKAQLRDDLTEAQDAAAEVDLRYSVLKAQLTAISVRQSMKSRKVRA